MNKIMNEDEIDLRELFGVLWKYRIFMVFLVVIICGITLAVTLLSPSRYTSSSQIFVDNDIDVHKNILTSSAVMDRLEDYGESGLAKKMDLEVEGIEGINLLNLKVTGSRPGEVRKFADTLLDTYFIFTAEKERRLKHERIRELKNSMDGYKRELNRQSRFVSVKTALGVEDIILHLEKDEEIWGQLEDRVLISQELNPIYRNIEQKIYRLKMDIGSVEYQLSNLENNLKILEDPDLKFEIGSRIGNIRIASYSSKPQREPKGTVRNLLFAFFLTLVASVFLAFTFEFISGYMERENKS